MRFYVAITNMRQKTEITTSMTELLDLQLLQNREEEFHHFGPETTMSNTPAKGNFLAAKKMITRTTAFNHKNQPVFTVFSSSSKQELLTLPSDVAPTTFKQRKDRKNVKAKKKNRK